MNAPDRSAQVDVLSVMDEGIAALMDGRSTLWTARDVKAMRVAVAELHAAGKRVIAAFEAIGRFPAPVATTALRAEAEAAMVALTAALARMAPQP